MISATEPHKNDGILGFASPTVASDARDDSTTVHAVSQPAQGNEPAAGVRRGAFGEYALPIAILAAAMVMGWWLWRWLRHSPRRALQRSVSKARQVNERVRTEHIPHPVPEMEAARDDVVGTPGSPFRPETRVSPNGTRAANRTAREDTREELLLDPRTEEALARLRALEERSDPKDPRTDYRRLDAFVRRYLFEFYGAKAFGLSSAGVLESLPQDITEGVVDYVGEILRVCELAELPRHRSSRSELWHLHQLAADMIVAHAPASSRD